MITNQELDQVRTDYNGLVSIIDWNGSPELFCAINGKKKSFKLPKNADITWVNTKISNWLNAEYSNLRPVFEKLGIKGNIYYTSFGFSYDCFFKNAETMKIETAELSKALDNIGIEYKNEYSDAFWVYRYKISQSKSNIDKINNLK